MMRTNGPNALVSYRRADMEPELVRFRDVPLTETNLFRPWSPAAEEIIIKPESVAELMDRIKQLNEPELAAIRQRNRAREHAAPKEIIHAQVIALAA